MRDEVRSYKQTPINLYQIQTKFRDEIRPRFGVMRAREFLMKDAYSFHADQPSLEATYQVMYETYSRIFTRTGLEFRAVRADSGAIGGSVSQEFHVLADSGEDAIAFSSKGDFAGNVETIPSPAPEGERLPQSLWKVWRHRGSTASRMSARSWVPRPNSASRPWSYTAPRPK